MARQEHLEYFCPICDSKEVIEELRVDRYAVARCLHCGVEFSVPQPDDETLAKIYSAHYFYSEREGILPSEVNRLKRETAKLYVDRIVSLQKDRQGKRLLEIGCGTGDFLAEAKARGFAVSGLELSEHAVAAANAQLGTDAVKQGHLESAALPEAEFDIVVFSDVIEHVRDPKSFLACVHRCLRPGGLVFIVTPSTDSWSRILMGRHWMEYKVEHLFYFNRRSLSRILGRLGFERIQFHRNVKILSFEYVRAHFRRHPVPLCNPVLEALGRMLPKNLASASMKLVPSGLIATATKAS